MDTNKMREQFEAYARTKNIDVSVAIMYACHPPKFARYAVREAQENWELWKASREAVVVELPYVRSYPANEAASDVDYYIDEGRHDMKAECRKAIESQGLKVAP